MEDRDAQFAIGIDVWVVEGLEEAELCGGNWSMVLRKIGMEKRKHTRWGIRVVRGEGHRGFEIAAVVQGIGVDDDQGNIPVKDVVIV